MIHDLDQRARLLRRLRRIVTVLARHGFYHTIKRLTLHRRLSMVDRLRYEMQHQREDRDSARALRQACGNWGRHSLNLVRPSAGART